MIETDVLIVGAGLAGLSLATRLADGSDQRFEGLNVTLIDPRVSIDFASTHAATEKTWCSWRLQSDLHPFTSSIDHAWTHGVIEDQRHPTSAAVRIDFSHARYERISESRLVRFALQRMAETPRVSLCFGQSVSAIEEQKSPDAGVFVQTSEKTYRTGIVFDTRPPAPSPKAWQQVFFGGEYEIAATSAQANLDTFTMMSFIESPRSRGARFIYALPMTANKWLLQATAFVPAATRADDMLNGQIADDMIAAYAARHGFSIAQCLRRENGVILMDPLVPPTTALDTMTNLGSRGGMIRAATGYSFTRVQRACNEIANAIAAWRSGAALPIALQWQARTTPLLDRIFLDALQRDDVDVAALFTSLARTCAHDGASLARFLDGHPGTADLTRVITAMPTLPFVTTALRALVPWHPRA
jgi:lycopene beta-cyclase